VLVGGINNMLISWSHRFIFVSNLKAASTAIIDALGPRSEIVVDRAELGKHFALHDIIARFEWIFLEVPFETFFCFGVIREPIDYMLSLYNSHLDEKFMEDKFLSTCGMEFSEFLRQWCSRHEGEAAPQASRFFLKDGQIGLNYILDYTSLASQFAEVCDLLELPPITLPRLNVSPRGLVKECLSEEEIGTIKSRYELDYKIYSTMTGKVLDGARRRGRVG
jgi:hypothetical protein